ncbi:MAG: DUF11 domain-containing protein [Chloroflexi bacterium]|nr:DUF11 domain-containing protein [Chloroflexota bacterium]
MFSISRRSQSGYVLMLTIIAVTVSMLIVVPVLSFVSTAHLNTIKTQERWESYLTRDAGVEYAIATLKNDRATLTSLSTAPLTPIALPAPPVETNMQAVTSLTGTLLTPSQWDMVIGPAGSREYFVSPWPVLPPRQPQTAARPTGEAGKEPPLTPGVAVVPGTDAAATASAPVMAVTKTASPTQVAPGDQVTYTIQLANTGDQTATTNSIVDNLASGSGFSYIIGSATGDITENPRVTQGGLRLTWDTIPSIAAGATLTFSFRVLTGSSTGQFYNSVTVDGSNYADISTGNTAPVFVGPRMRATKTVSPSIAAAGTNVTYTVTIFNDTPGASAGLTEINDTLAAGFSYVTGSTTGAITANPQVTGQVNLKWTGSWTIAGGGSFTFSFQATTSLNWGTFYNTVSIKGSNFPDYTTGPTAALTTVGWIQIAKTVDNGTPGENELIRYTITVNNIGPSAVSISKFVDTLATSVEYQAGQTTGSITVDPNIIGRFLTWQGAGVPASIAAGGQLSFSFVAQVQGTADTFYNEVDIYVSWLGNNYVIGTGPTAGVSVITQPRIAISETYGDTSGPPGWANLNVKGYSFPPNKTVILYWVDLNNPLDPRTDPPTGTNLIEGQTLITLSTSYAPLSFNPVSVTIPSNANWGNGYIVAVMEKSGGTWVEQDRKPFNVRAKYEIASQTADEVTLTARVAFTGNRSPDGAFSTPTNTPLITIYQWKE